MDIKGRGDETLLLDLSIEWHRLQALQELSIRRFRLKFGDGVAGQGLLQLPHLRQISIAGSLCDDQQDNEQFAALVYNLARRRPQVKLNFEKTTLGI